MQHRVQSPATNLLVSMLIRFPDISLVRYLTDEQELSFEYLLINPLKKTRWDGFMAVVYESFYLVGQWDHDFPMLGELKYVVEQNITVISYKQKLKLLRTTEIGLLSELIAQYFQVDLPKDGFCIDIEDIDAHEEMIETALQQYEEWAQEKRLVAYRDEGKVFIYNHN